MKRVMLILATLFIVACSGVPDNPAPEPQSYIVVYKKNMVTTRVQLIQLADEHSRLYAASKPRILGIINGFSALFTEKSISQLKKLPQVEYVEKDGVVTIQK